MRSSAGRDDEKAIKYRDSVTMKQSVPLALNYPHKAKIMTVPIDCRAMWRKLFCYHVTLLAGAVEGTSVNIDLDVLGGLTIDGATNGESSSQDLLQGSLESSRLRLVSHGSSDLEDLISSDVTVVEDVLRLLSVSHRLLQLLDNQGGGVGDDLGGSLSVDDGQLSGNSDTLPVQRDLLDVLTNLLGRHTERTDLGSKDGRGTNLTTVLSDVHNLNVTFRLRGH